MASAVPTAGMVTGTDLVCALAVTTGTAPPPPRRPAPRAPPAPAAPAPFPRAACAPPDAEVGSAAFCPEQATKERQKRPKTMDFDNVRDIRTVRNLAAYKNDSNPKNVYFPELPANRPRQGGAYAPVSPGSEVRLPDACQDPRFHGRCHPGPRDWDRRERRDVLAGQRAAAEAARRTGGRARRPLQPRPHEG